MLPLEEEVEEVVEVGEEVVLAFHRRMMVQSQVLVQVQLVLDEDVQVLVVEDEVPVVVEDEVPVVVEEEVLVHILLLAGKRGMPGQILGNQGETVLSSVELCFWPSPFCCPCYHPF